MTARDHQPWLAPDGREWGARRLARSPRLPYVAPRLRDLARAAGVFVAPPQTPVARACKLSISSLRAGPIGRAALWEVYR